MMASAYELSPSNPFNIHPMAGYIHRMNPDTSKRPSWHQNSHSSHKNPMEKPEPYLDGNDKPSHDEDGGEDDNHYDKNKSK